MNDPLLAWRKEFPILGHTTYMISHSLGAMPRRVSDRLQQFADTWAARGIRAWEEGWWEMPVTVGDLIGSIIGAGQGEVVMHLSARDDSSSLLPVENAKCRPFPTTNETETTRVNVRTLDNVLAAPGTRTPGSSRGRRSALRATAPPADCRPYQRLLGSPVSSGK